MHHVWLEPEGLDSHVLYPNGLSNSLEPEDQIELLRTIPGDPLNLCDPSVWTVVQSFTCERAQQESSIKIVT